MAAAAAAGGGSPDHELKLLGSTNPSPFVTRVELALALRGLTYDLVAVDLDRKTDLLLAANPVHAKVPVLIHRGRPVCESRVILEYIDDAFPCAAPPLLPPADDPLARAAARFWAAHVDDEFVASWRPAYLGSTEGERAEGMARMAAAVGALEGALAAAEGKPFFGGDAPGLVDVTLGSVIPRTRANEALTGSKVLEAATTPLLAAWAERFGELDAARKVLPAVGDVVEYLETRLRRSNVVIARKQ
uniref:Glutathione S-transferase n=1 Tax=Oryza meridionalis TaxID=40149 RepID=A0A0E0EX12_9ORYZ